MSEPHFTNPAAAGKPAKPARPSKPRPDFPLFPHASGHWAKKIRGKTHFFGAWGRRVNGRLERLPGDGADAALKKYDAEKEALHAGRKPRLEAGDVTLKELCNDFLNAKQARVDTGEQSPRTWACYKAACVSLVAELGKSRLVADLGPDDFAALRNKLAKRYGPHGLGTAIQCVRCVAKYAFDSGLVDRPVRFGPGFKRPSKKVLRLHRAKQGPKLFTAEEVRALAEGALVVGTDGPELVQAGAQLRAMILLGINCGFGNTDCGRLPISAVDLDDAMIDFPRPKTGIPRRCPLWPETVQAIKEALAHRPEPKKAENAGLVFITQRGLAWAKDTNDCPVAKETAKLLHRLGINGRKGIGFYTLRHVFRTVADGAKDQPAADHIMGHEVAHMSSVYREGISDDRLRAVSDHVRAWLFNGSKEGICHE